MIEYIYFVKCPNCEDEHFDFFDEAKAFALGCLSQKPIITQIEVCRNDFGECTDSSDLGTVWSWEDECKDCHEVEKAPEVFTRGDFDKYADGYDPDNDPEFVDDDSDFRFINELEEGISNGVSFRNSEDFAEFKKLCDEIGLITMGDLDRFMKENDANDANILDKLREYRAELGPDFKIKEAYTDPETECIYNDNIECTNNEDCTDCPNNPKNTVYNGKTLKELVEEMEENEDEVECTWCNDLFPKDYCKKEVNLGYLCPRCADGIMSRGEKLAFVENNYWDFLDEKLDIDLSNCVDHSDFEIWGIDRDNKAVILKRYENVDCRDRKAEQKIYDEMHDTDGAFVFMFAKDGSPILLSWNPYVLSLYNGQEIIFDDARYDEAATKALTRKFDEAFPGRDPFDHHDPDYDEDEAADYLAHLIDDAKDRRYDDALDDLDAPLPEYRYTYDEKTGTHTCKRVDEEFDGSEKVELYYPDLTVTAYGHRRDVDDWDEWDVTGEYVYEVDKNDVAEAIWNEFITEEDAADVPGGLDTLEDEKEYDKFLEVHFDELFDKYYDKLLDYFEKYAEDEASEDEDFINNY